MYFLHSSLSRDLDGRRLINGVMILFLPILIICAAPGPIYAFIHPLNLRITQILISKICIHPSTQKLKFKGTESFFLVKEWLYSCLYKMHIKINVPVRVKRF